MLSWLLRTQGYAQLNARLWRLLSKKYTHCCMWARSFFAWFKVCFYMRRMPGGRPGNNSPSHRLSSDQSGDYSPAPINQSVLRGLLSPTIGLHLLLSASLGGGRLRGKGLIAEAIQAVCYYALGPKIRATTLCYIIPALQGSSYAASPYKRIPVGCSRSLIWAQKFDAQHEAWSRSSDTFPHLT